MYYLQSRYYDANIGRFINADDVEMLFDDQGTLVQYNLFVYCGNSVIINLDPNGKGFISWIKKLFGIGKNTANMIKNKKQAEAIINADVKNVVNYGAGSRKYDESKFKIKNKKKYEEHLQNAYNHLKVRIMYLYGYQNIGVLEGKKWNQLSGDVKSTINKYKNEWNKTFVTKVVVKASFKNIKSAFGIMCKTI